MTVDGRVVLVLRVFLLGFFGILVVFQVLSMPGQFAYMAEESPDLAYLRWPLTVVSVSWILCIQVVVVSTWRLLGLVQEGRIFSEASAVWMDAIVWALAAAWVLIIGVLGFFASTWDDPGVPMVLILVSFAVAVLGLLAVVVRGLLREAAMLRSRVSARPDAE